MAITSFARYATRAAASFPSIVTFGLLIEYLHPWPCLNAGLKLLRIRAGGRAEALRCRGTDPLAGRGPHKGLVMAEDIPIDPFPVAIRIGGQGVRRRDGGQEAIVREQLLWNYHRSRSGQTG